MGRKRKSTEILEILNEKPTVTESIPTPPVSDPGNRSPELFPPSDVVHPPEPVVETIKTPEQVLPQPSVPPEIQKPTRKRKEKDPLTEEIKKIRKNQEDYRRFQEEQEKRLEARLENMLNRKLDFMRPTPIQKPIQNYRPKQVPTIRRISPPREEYEEYLTQEDEEEENALFHKIFS